MTTSYNQTYTRNSCNSIRESLQPRPLPSVACAIISSIQLNTRTTTDSHWSSRRCHRRFGNHPAVYGVHNGSSHILSPPAAGTLNTVASSTNSDRPQVSVRGSGLRLSKIVQASQAQDVVALVAACGQFPCITAPFCN